MSGEPGPWGSEGALPIRTTTTTYRDGDQQGHITEETDIMGNVPGLQTGQETAPANGPPPVSHGSPGAVGIAAEGGRTPPGGTGHIGRVVAGSLSFGLAAAVAIVVVPLAGAREHAITGSVLITFAFAWAILALFAERRTNQPQRWAVVPASFMALTGAAILVLAPTGNQLGWVWPPVVATLTIWMIVRARRELRSRTRTWLLYPVFAALVLSALGGGYETYGEATDRSRYPMPGRLVDIGDHSLHINCTGSGSPTVVLEPGLGEPSTVLAWITPDVATTTRVCVYDRAGRGWSESASGPQDGAQVATDLHTLLERAGEPGPYVLAGHSAGGIYVLNFARLYPEQTAGVALLDSMHPEQYTRIASWPLFYHVFRRVSAVLPSLSRLGAMRVLGPITYGDLPPRARDEQRAFWATPRHNRSVRDEFSQLRTAMAQANALPGMADRPLVVVTAASDALGGWLAAQGELAALSSNSDHRVIPEATHDTLVADREFAAQASQAIRDVVDAVRTGTPVTG